MRDEITARLRGNQIWDLTYSIATTLCFLPVPLVKYKLVWFSDFNYFVDVQYLVSIVMVFCTVNYHWLMFQWTPWVVSITLCKWNPTSCSSIRWLIIEHFNIEAPYRSRLQDRPRLILIKDAGILGRLLFQIKFFFYIEIMNFKGNISIQRICCISFSNFYLMRYLAWCADLNSYTK